MDIDFVKEQLIYYCGFHRDDAGLIGAVTSPIVAINLGWKRFSGTQPSVYSNLELYRIGYNKHTKVCRSVGLPDPETLKKQLDRVWGT